MATDVLEALGTADDSEAERSDAAVETQENTAVRALIFIFDHLEPSRQFELQLEVVRGDLEDLVRRVERTLDAADYDKHRSEIQRLKQMDEHNFSVLRETVDDCKDKTALQIVQLDIQQLEVEVAVYEDSVGTAARDEVDAALEGEEDPLWREKMEAARAVLAKARAEVTREIPWARVRMRGSLATGWKGPHKVTDGAATRFNASDFDADAFIEVTNDMWLEMYLEDRVKESDMSEKVSNLDGWEHQPKLAQLEEKVGQQLVQAAQGYRVVNGVPDFYFTVQPTSSSWVNLIEGLQYPRGAFEAAEAGNLEDALPAADPKQSRFPGIFVGE
jgi:hypothetical protein